MASNLRVDTILPSTGTTLGIGTASGTINFLGNSNIVTSGTLTAASASITGNLGVGGTLTYEDVTNIDSVGVVTARTDINLGDSIIHIGDTNTKIRFPAADTITAETGGSERVRINTDGDLLVGRTSTIDTSERLGIKGLGSDHCTFGITSAGNTQAGIIAFNDDDATFRGRIQYNHNGDSMQFNTAGSERVRITSGGDVCINSTGLSSPYTTFRNLSINNNLILNAQNAAGGFAGVQNNAYLNSSGNWVRVNNDHATSIGTDDGVFYFRNAGAGTGNISWNHRLTILANGHILTNGNTSLPTGSTSGFGFSSDQFYISYTGTSANYIQRFYNSNGLVGSIMVNGSSTTYNTSSDYRLKENQVAISDGITRLKTLKPYRFNFKTDSSKTVDGFFAHEVTAVPEAIAGEKDGTEMQSIDHSKLVPLITAALQEAITEIETLKAEVAALKSS